MTQNLTWYLFLWLASVVATILTWQFGPVGIFFAATFSLIIGVAVPNSFIFKKPPNSVHYKSGYQFYRNEAVWGFMFVTFIISGLATSIFVWADSPHILASQLKSELITTSLIGKSLPAIEVLSRPETYEFSASEYRQKQMHNHFPRASLWAIIMRAITYLIISFALVLFTFERVRSERAATKFTTANRPTFRHYMTALGFGALLIWTGDLFSALPYLLWPPNLPEELLLVACVLSFWVSVFAMIGAITSVLSKLFSNQSVDLNSTSH